MLSFIKKGSSPGLQYTQTCAEEPFVSFFPFCLQNVYNRQGQIMERKD